MASKGESFLKKLHVQILIAMVIGALLGVIFKSEAILWFGWMGEIFIRLLKMVIVPLVFSSLVVGLMSLGQGKELGRLGGKTILYFTSTSLLAICVGLFFVNLFEPGVDPSKKNKEVLMSQKEGQVQENKKISDAVITAKDFSLKEYLIKMIPTNFIQAMSESKMIGIIIFGIFFGLGIRAIPEDKRGTMQNWFESFYEVMITITNWIIRLAPLGVIGLMSQAVGDKGLEAFRDLAYYMLTVFSGVAFHMLVTMSILLLVFGRINPFKHLKNMMPALLTAFSTSSSSATLPVTIRTLQSHVGVSKKISSFVLPIGATINMDGTALYECAGVLFIAQVLGIPMSMDQQIVIVFVALMASIGAAGIPSAGLVMIFVVLEAVNLNTPEAFVIVGAMLAVDRPLDMCRTAVNVYSDSCAATLIARSEGEKLNS